MLQIEDKDLPILSHLIDVEVVHLRDEPPTASTKSEDEDEDDEDDSPKVTFCTALNKTVSLYRVHHPHILLTGRATISTRFASVYRHGSRGSSSQCKSDLSNKRIFQAWHTLHMHATKPAAFVGLKNSGFMQGI